MPKEKTAKEVYEELVSKGFYEKANRDKDEMLHAMSLAIEDYRFGRSLRAMKNPNWRVIFNINYDVLREICSCLAMSEIFG